MIGVSVHRASMIHVIAEIVVAQVTLAFGQLLFQF